MRRPRALEIAGLARWTWVVDLPMAAAVLYLAFKWGLLRSFTARLLAVLHLSLMALALSLVLFAIQSLTLAISGERVLGLAPLHAMTIGYFSAMVIGMVSGYPLATAEILSWRIASRGSAFSAYSLPPRSGSARICRA